MKRKVRAKVTQAATLALLCMPVVLAAGCNSVADGPVTWWHDLEGGRIAQDRPPPPDANAPWPHIQDVPKRPVIESAAYRAALQSRLLAEHDLVQRSAADAPLVVIPPPPPPAPPPVMPENGDTQASASLDASDSPPPPKTPPKPAAPATAPAAAQAGKPATAGDAPLLSPTSEPEIASAVAGAPPELQGPPPPPSFMAGPAVPAPSLVLPVAAPQAPAGTFVAFTPGLSDFLPSQAPTLKSMAGQIGHGTIGVIGLGEAASDTPDGQAKALKLALARAQTISTQLQTMGVSAGKIRIFAYAFGQGARLTLNP